MGERGEDGIGGGGGGGVTAPFIALLFSYVKSSLECGF